MPTLGDPELSPAELGFMTATTLGILGTLAVYRIMGYSGEQEKTRYLISSLVGSGIHYIALGIPV
jgi:uncharacterized membrane protein YeaQ/YmgE (transglycosylase-associated protein family)